MQVVSRDPDRVKALGSVLTPDNPGSNRLIRWAVAKLESMHSPSADAELDRFADQLARLSQLKGLAAGKSFKISEGV